MKKFKFILPILIIAVCCLLAACAQGTPEEQLSAPQNLHMEDTDLVWDEVENASGYVVYFQGEEHETQNCYYSLSDLSEPAEYVIRVFAVGDGKKYRDSKRSKFTYKIEEEKEEPVIPTANLAYMILQDKSGYKVSCGQADLAGVIVIPDYYKGLPVKKIADNAFYYLEVLGHNIKTGYGCNTKTTGIRLPKTLEEIGDRAFADCTALKEVAIPEGVKIIGPRAFSSCVKLEKVVLPSTLTEIGSSAFSDCAFSEVTLPEGVKCLGSNLFSGCNALAEINFPQMLEYVEGCVFENTAWLANQPDGFVTVKTVNGDVLIGYNGVLPNGGVIDNIPTSVTHISVGTFTGTEIVSIKIPSGVTLGDSIFFGSKSKGCFSECTSLKKVVLPEGLEKLPKYVFRNCSSLKEINIPNSLKEIGPYAFNGCKALEELILSSSIEVLGDYAFSGCVALKELTLSSSLKVVGQGVFGTGGKIKVFYEGALSEWQDKQTFEYGINRNVYYYVQEEADVPDDGDNYWHYVDGEPVVWTKEN